jgi:hypothetical protein
MGLITGTALAAKAATILNDPTNTRWTTTELLGWINTAQKEIAVFKPTASVVNANIATVIGTKQQLPTSSPVGLQLIEVIRNMGTGSTPGKAITKISRDVIDQVIPDWHAIPARSSLSVVHHVYDAKGSADPKVFYVYPPLTAATQFLEVSMGVVPADLAAIGSAISIDDIYESPLIDYILYRAFSKDSANPSNASRAAGHQTAYMNAIGGKVAAESTYTPKQKTQG